VDYSAIPKHMTRTSNPKHPPARPPPNRYATHALIDVSTGLARGAVVGNAYAIRADRKDFTVKEFEALYDRGISSVLDKWSGGAQPQRRHYESWRAAVAKAIANPQPDDDDDDDDDEDD